MKSCRRSTRPVRGLGGCALRDLPPDPCPARRDLGPTLPNSNTLLAGERRGQACFEQPEAGKDDRDLRIPDRHQPDQGDRARESPRRAIPPVLIQLRAWFAPIALGQEGVAVDSVGPRSRRAGQGSTGRSRRAQPPRPRTGRVDLPATLHRSRRASSVSYARLPRQVGDQRFQQHPTHCVFLRSWIAVVMEGRMAGPPGHGDCECTLDGRRKTADTALVLAACSRASLACRSLSIHETGRPARKRRTDGHAHP